MSRFDDIKLIQETLDGHDYLGTGSDSRGAERERIEVEKAWERIKDFVERFGED